MASDNRAYTQFEDSHSTPTVRYGPTTPTATFANDQDAKTLKKWKNSRRLCWVLLATALATLVLETIGAGISGVHLDWFLVRFVIGIWLAALGVASAGLGLGAFKNPFQNSKCLTIAHFSLTIISTIAYGILFIMAARDVSRTRQGLEAFHDYFEVPDQMEDEDDSAQNVTAIANSTVTTTTMADYDEALPLLHAIRGNLAVSVFLLGTTLTFFIISILASVLICRQWCKDKEKTMTIVYMPQDGSGHGQTQQVVVPSKTQVVVVPPPKSANGGPALNG